MAKNVKVAKKVVKTPEEVAFEKFIAKEEFKNTARSAGKKKLFEVFKAGVKFGVKSTSK